MVSHIYKYTSTCNSQIPHPRSGDSQDQKTFLAPSADKPTRNSDIECSNHNSFLSILKPKGLRHSKIKWWATHTNIPVHVIVRLPHPRSADSQGQETFSALSADKQTRNQDKECSNHHPSLSTLRSKRLSRSKMKWWAIYTNLPMDVIVRLPHRRRGKSQSQKMFLAPSADKQTRNYHIECSNHHPSLLTLTPKGLSHSKMKWWAIYTNLPMDVIVRLPHRQSWNSQVQETFLAPSVDNQTCNYDIECSNHHPSLSTLRRLAHSKMKWWAKYIYINIPKSVIVRIPHPRSGDSQCPETFLAPSADKPTGNYHIECSNHHPSLSTLTPKGLIRSKMKWWAIYTNLPMEVTVRLPHCRSGKSQGQKTFLAPSAAKQTRNYDIKCSNHHPPLSTLTPKGFWHSKMKWWAIYTNFPVDVLARLPHPRTGNSQVQETFLAPSADKQTRNYYIDCSSRHLSLSSLSPKGLSRSKMKWWAINTNLALDVIVRLPHPTSGDSQDQETSLAPSAEKPTRNYDIEYPNHRPSLSTLRPKGLCRSKMKWWAKCTNFPMDAIDKLPDHRSGESQNQETFLAPSADKQTATMT